MANDDGKLAVALCHGKNAVGSCENIVLAVWGEAPSAGPMHAIHRTHLDLLEKYPRVGHLAMIVGAPRFPTQEAREVAADYNQRSRMTSIGVVVDGEGFWLSAARGFLTAVLFVQRSGAKTQVFKYLEEGLRWQGDVLGSDAPNMTTVRRAIESLRDLAMSGDRSSFDLDPA